MTKWVIIGLEIAMAQKRAKFGRPAATGRVVESNEMVIRATSKTPRVKISAASGTAELSKFQVELLAKRIMRGFTFKTAKIGRRWYVVPSEAHPPRSLGPKTTTLEGTGIPSPVKSGDLQWASDEQLETAADDTSLISSDELAQLLQVSRETVHRWRKDGKLLGFEMAKRGFRFPKEQLDARGRPLDGLQEVVATLGGDHWAAWRLLRARLPELGDETGFELLSEGKLDKLQSVLTARAYGAFT